MDKDVLRGVLQRPIAFHPALARALGSINSAVFVGQLLYWTGKQEDPDGWIYKTQAEIEEETTLTRYEQEGARRVALSLGVLFEERRGIPAKMYYRVSVEAIYGLLLGLPSAIKNGEKPHTGMGKTINHSIDIDYSKTTSSEATASRVVSSKKEKKPTPITVAESRDLVSKLKQSENDSHGLIGHYLAERGTVFSTKEAFNEALRRHLKIAKLLVESFTQADINRGFDMAKQKFPEEYTLETILKMLTK